MASSERPETGDQSFRIWIILILAISGAISFWANSSGWPNSSEWPILDHLRKSFAHLIEAVFIAMALALTVDIYLKQGLTRDAFKASIGYILPRYLQQEMAAIYSNEVICEEHSQVVILTPLPNDLMRVTLKLKRKLTNISSNSHTFNPLITVDEWLAAEAPSNINEVGYRKNGGPDVLPHESISPQQGDVPTLGVHLPVAQMLPNDTIELWFSFDEIKRRNDMHVMRFRYSTHNPRVRVDAPPEIGWRVVFTHRQDAKTERYFNETELPGLLLPYQCIFVRWWDKATESNWRKGHNSDAGPKTG